MKKQILLISLLLLTALYARAQRHSIGLIGGLSNTTAILDSKGPQNINQKTNLLMGIQANVDLDKHWFFAPEIVYRQNGYSFKPGGIEYQADYSYFAIPIKIGFQVGSKIRGFVNTGLTPAFLLDAQTTGPLNGPADGFIDPKQQSNIRVFTPSFDLSGLVGVGVKYSFGNFLVSLEGRYNQSFSKFDDFIVYYAETASHQSWQMLLGVHYTLGEK
ncbi:hypothetical protein BKI52_28835 [marine bacterium AO1-C]|nr:hypothetical protein BKI52_28835 [marine bacterium AO1-C]